jgi:hypothetical protein
MSSLNLPRFAVSDPRTKGGCSAEDHNEGNPTETIGSTDSPLGSSM